MAEDIKNRAAKETVRRCGKRGHADGCCVRGGYKKQDECATKKPNKGVFLMFGNKRFKNDVDEAGL